MTKEFDVAGTPPKTNLLVLTNSMIEAMSTNRGILENFGECFSGLGRDKSCNKCGDRARHGESDYARVKDCIGGLPPRKKLLLLRMLETNKIRLDVRRDGKRITLTF